MQLHHCLDSSIVSNTLSELLRNLNTLQSMIAQNAQLSAAKQRLSNHVSTEIQFLDKQSVAR
jgi:hypothetical protein